MNETVRSIESPPPLSVAMSVYNGERFLAKAIESVLSQTFGEFEFLIVDDGSSDGSTAMIEDYARRDRRIRPIIRENRGLIASLNQLLAEARAPLIARMDADDICHPERFAKQVAFLDSHPDHGVVGSWTSDIDENGALLPNLPPEHPATHEEFMESVKRDGPLLCHPATMFRRDEVLGVGGYHAAFKHCEDLDLWLRLATRTKIANIPERLIIYRHYDEQISSRHTTQQQIGHVVAQFAFARRQAGLPDPTENLDDLPPVGTFDAAFGVEGLDRQIRARLASKLLYSRSGLRDQGFDLILQHLREGGSHANMWRTVVRLLTFGEPVRAARLAATLATTA